MAAAAAAGVIPQLPSDAASFTFGSRPLLARHLAASAPCAAEPAALPAGQQRPTQTSLLRAPAGTDMAAGWRPAMPASWWRHCCVCACWGPAAAVAHGALLPCSGRKLQALCAGCRAARRCWPAGRRQAIRRPGHQAACIWGGGGKGKGRRPGLGPSCRRGLASGAGWGRGRRGSEGGRGGAAHQPGRRRRSRTQRSGPAAARSARPTRSPAR